MIMGGKTLKKRKTVANKKTANPVYNEAFVFTLLPSYLDRVSFMLSVFTVTRLGGSKKLIGRAVVGPYMYSTDQGLSHWNDMINSPRNPVAQWHTLIWKKRFHKIKEIYFRNTNKPAEPQLQTSELSEDSRILSQSGSVKISIMPSKITEKKPDPYGQRSERDKNMKKNQMLKVNLHDFFGLQHKPKYRAIPKYLYYIKLGFHLQGSHKRKRKNPYFTVKTACKHKNKLKNCIRLFLLISCACPSVRSHF